MNKAILTTLIVLMSIYPKLIINNLRLDTSPSNDVLISDSMFFKSKYPPDTIESHVLGSLIGSDRIIKRENLTPYPELNRIIWYESKNDPTAQNPKSSAYGYCQMIKTTREWVARDILEETGYIIDYKSPKDQLQACIYLYENGIPKNEWLETMYLWSY